MLDLHTELENLLQKQPTATQNIKDMIKYGFSRIDSIKLSDGTTLTGNNPSPEFVINQSKLNNLSMTWRSIDNFLASNEPEMVKMYTVAMLDDIAKLHDKYDRSPNLDDASRKSLTATLKESFSIIEKLNAFKAPESPMVDLTSKIVTDMTSKVSQAKTSDIRVTLLENMYQYLCEYNKGSAGLFESYRKTNVNDVNALKKAFNLFNSYASNGVSPAQQLQPKPTSAPKPTMQSKPVLQDSADLANSIESILNGM